MTRAVGWNKSSKPPAASVGKYDLPPRMDLLGKRISLPTTSVSMVYRRLFRLLPPPKTTKNIKTKSKRPTEK